MNKHERATLSFGTARNPSALSFPTACKTLALSFPTTCIFNITKSETHLVQASPLALSFPTACIFNITKSEAVIVQASVPSPCHSRPPAFQNHKVRNTLSSGESPRIVIPDRLHNKIIKSETHFVQASSGISESKPKHLSRIVIPDRLH
ncbi:MAG: hypothetical protein SGI89_14765, partial [bacterium]|nr:hypothetical protein [bacterium]